MVCNVPYETIGLISDTLTRPAMRKRPNLCCTASAKLRRQSLGLGPGATGAHAWRAHVRACANASDGEEKSCVKLVGRCQKFKTVCNFVILVEVRVFRLSQQLV
jgi:hypothetical protein